MNIRFYNARILTMETDRPIFNGEIWVSDERIVYVGEAAEGTQLYQEEKAASPRWKEEIDCKGNLLMPGFKNAHTHSAMTFLRSFADDLPLQEWLNEQVFPMEAKLTGEDIYTLTKLAVLEYLTSGITSIFDMYLNTDMAAKACMEMGMRCVFVSGLNNFSSSVKQVEEEYLKWNKASPLLGYRLGFHAEYTCSEELLRQISALAHKYQEPVYTHISETEREVKECLERHGMTPPSYLNSLGLFDFGGAGYHCVHATDEDLDIFLNRGIYVVTNPGSNTKLASGIAPVNDFIKKGIPVAIGTDGAASNNCLDMFREMFLVTGLAKLREKDASCVDAMDVLRMATVGGAGAMCLKEADVLAEGKLADMIMIDLHQPNMQPIHNICKNIVYSGSKQNIAMTMIHGRILYRNGEFYTGEDKEDIYQAAEGIVKRMLLQ